MLQSGYAQGPEASVLEQQGEKQVCGGGQQVEGVCAVSRDEGVQAKSRTGT
jgi:hypothetical protein